MKQKTTTVWSPAQFVRYVLLLSFILYLVASILIFLGLLHGRVVYNDLLSLSDTIKNSTIISLQFNIALSKLLGDFEKMTFLKAFGYGIITSATVFGALAFYYYWKIRKFLRQIASNKVRR